MKTAETYLKAYDDLKSTVFICFYYHSMNKNTVLIVSWEHRAVPCALCVMIQFSGQVLAWIDILSISTPYAVEQDRVNLSLIWYSVGNTLFAVSLMPSLVSGIRYISIHPSIQYMKLSTHPLTLPNYTFPHI